MIQLTDREFQKLAEEIGVSEFDLRKLNSLGILRDGALLDILIQHDFKKIRRTGKYKTSMIVARLAMFYHTPQSRILNAIHSKNVSLYYCKECGKLIKRAEYMRNKERCDECVIKSIELP